MRKARKAKAPAPQPQLKMEYRPVAELIPYTKNPRTHSDAQIGTLIASIKEFGWTNPILLDGDRGILAGHARLTAALKLGLQRVPTIDLSHLTDPQKRAYVIADNRIAELAGWDRAGLGAELQALNDLHFPLEPIGFTVPSVEELLAAGGPSAGEVATLADRFMLPPFSVLNAREGWWQQRKRAWLALGIKSEIGRGDNLLQFSDTMRDPKKKRAQAKAFDTAANIGEGWTGTSIFDPVLCELCYRWFCPPGGAVFDPFAGGSVRGIVAWKLGRQYTGVDLSAAQVAANREQAAAICKGKGKKLAPAWIEGDARQVDRTLKGKACDFLFSCPPYADLERYSDNPADLSTMTFPEFLAAYRGTIAKACALLKPNRFACFVVGEVRAQDDKAGAYRNLVGETVRAFIDAGLGFYNEAILVTMLGTLPLRVAASFSGTRKLGKTHQNVLMFVKGDPRKAAEACGKVDVAVPEADAPDLAPAPVDGDPAAAFGEVLVNEAAAA